MLPVHHRSAQPTTTHGTQRAPVTTIETLQRAVDDLSAEVERERTFNAAVHRIARTLTAQHELDAIVQSLTDEATALCRAQFGAFFYNVVDDRGEALMLYTLSGAPRAAFSRFPLPRATPLFGATFRNEGTVRCDDVRKDPRFGAWGPVPDGHLPVVSYLAVSVIARDGSVIGGLFFGHGQPGIFTIHDERAIEAIAAHASIAIENARFIKAAREAEAERRKSEERFRSLVAATSQVVWTTDAAGLVNADSPSWRAFTGQTVEAWMGEGWLDAIHPDDRAKAAAAWNGATEAKSLYEVEYRIRHVSGDYRVTVARGTPVFNDDGSVREWVGANTDITERRLLENSIANERSRLVELFMQAPAAIAVVQGPDHVFTVANPLYCQLVGKSVSQLIGWPGRRAFPELVEQGVWDLLTRVFDTGEPWFGREFPAKLDRLGDGRLDEGYFNFTAQPTRDVRGAVDGIMIFAVEVTAQVLARKFVEAVVERVPVPIVLIEPITARVTFSNAAADAMWGTGMPRASSADEYREYYRLFTPEGVPVPSEEMPGVRAARGETLRGLRLELETPKGRISTLIDSASVPGLPGHPGTTVVSFQDVSQLVSTERALRDAVRVRDEFLSIASHELNTPLTPLKLQIAALRAGGLPPAKIERKLAMADRQIDRLAVLISDLLEVSRISAGGMKMEPETVPVAPVAREIAESVEAGASAQVRIAVAGDDHVAAHVDRLRLEQVLTNLLTNAVKYGRDNPIDVTIAPVGSMVVLRVCDRGIGIAQDQLAKVFERFERAVSVRNFGGFGLGLWIVRQIVESWGGTVTVQSTVGEGSTFEVTMPRAEAAA